MSIEEMAKRYADQRVKNNIPKGYQNYSFEIQKSMPIFDGYLVEEACEYGAKAVLEEIEKVIDASKFYSDMSTFTLFYKDLVNKIQELKG